MVNSEAPRRLRHIALLVLTWYVLMPGGSGIGGTGAERAAAAPGVDTAGHAVLNQNVIYRTNGSQLRLTLPKGVMAAAAAQVPAGWIVEAGTDKQGMLYFFDDRGTGRRIGYLRGSWALTADGRSLIATGLTPAPATGTTISPNVVAYDLPSLRVRAQKAFPGGVGPVILGATADRVLLRQGQKTPKPAIAAIWQLSTNALHPTTAPAWTFSIGGTATVLRRVDKMSGTKVTSACLDAVNASRGTIPVGPTGACSATLANVRGGMLSPDGRWATIFLSAATASTTTPPTVVLASTADLNAGRWRPIAMPKNTFVQYWDGPATMIAAAVAGENVTMQRCGTNGRCTALRLPNVGAQNVPQIIPRYGR